MPQLTEGSPAEVSGRRVSRRDEILSAAITCFQEHGFHACSMAELAKEASMSVGHIYHYFQSKDAIIEAIVDRDAKALADELDQVLQADDVVATWMTRLAPAVFKHLNRENATIRLEVLAEAARNPRIAAKLHAVVAEAQARARRVMAKALGNADPQTVAERTEALATIFQGLTMRALQNPDIDREGALRTTRLLVQALLSAPVERPRDVSSLPTT